MEDTNINSKGQLVIKDGVNWQDVDPILKANIEKLVSRGAKIRITSGKDSTHSPKSHHYRGQAIDITPIDKSSYDELLHHFKSNTDVLEELKKSGYKLLDERSRGGKEWSGAHFHIGRDSRVPIDNWDTIPLKVKSVQNKVDQKTKDTLMDGLLNKGYSKELASVISKGLSDGGQPSIPTVTVTGTKDYWNYLANNGVAGQTADSVDSYLKQKLGSDYDSYIGVGDPDSAYGLYSKVFMDEDSSKEVNSTLYLNSMGVDTSAIENTLNTTEDTEKDLYLQELKERQAERNMMLKLANDAVIDVV